MTRRELHLVAVVYAVLWSVLLAACALTSVVPGLDATVRVRLDLRLIRGSSPPLSVVAALAMHNASIALWPLAGIAAGLHRSHLRVLVDSLLALTLTANAGVVGMALSAYGRPLARFLPHLPLELLGLALPAASWLLHRQGDSGRIVVVARRTAAVLTIAALIEVYAT